MIENVNGRSGFQNERSIEESLGGLSARSFLVNDKRTAKMLKYVLKDIA
jgi:hypothetical protein